jgi:hypothetical protein
MELDMSIFEMKYRAGEFAERIQTTPDMLRDWRRRGFDIGIGVSVNGQKQYCDYDRLEARIHAQLREDAFDSIKDAFEAARHITPFVAKKLGFDLTDFPRYWAQTVHSGADSKYAMISGKRDYTYTSNLTHFMANDAMAQYMRPVCTVIDMDHIADRVADWAKNQIGNND